ncbi:MAG: cyclic nucleotide-binding domain-containing protein [Gammaproteobacteria bacterium]|nr:cyclic nucleotide-binding domain-containing protein [Gammaproteobacteria bacterium]
MIDVETLRNYVPMDTLTEETLDRLARRVDIEEFPMGAAICKEGDTDNDSIYLLEGGVEMISRSSTMKRLFQGGTPDANFALAQGRPRPATITATTKVKIFRVDTSKLDRVVLLDGFTTTVPMFSDEENPFKGDTEWLEEMTESKILKRLSKEKLPALLMKLEAMPVKRGNVVFKQGDRGDYYYIVKSGRFTISRKDTQGKVQILDELRKGSVFGEESLISGKTRNASVVAMGDGTLMRLAKADFQDLLKQPLLSYVTPEEAQRMISSGAKLVDVRSPQEFRTGSVWQSANIPLADIRKQMDSLDSDVSYVLCCKLGMHSEVAAFLMSQRGFHVYVLKGGIDAARKL